MVIHDCPSCAPGQPCIRHSVIEGCRCACELDNKGRVKAGCDAHEEWLRARQDARCADAVSQRLRRVTLEEYIEANGSMASFLNGMAEFAEANGFDWNGELNQMMNDVEQRARLFARLGVTPCR